MALTWKNLVAQIKDAGYEGDSDDLGAVSEWFADNGHDPSQIDTGDGVIELKTLFNERSGKPFDAKAAAQATEEEAKIDRIVTERLKNIEKATGFKLRSGTPRNPHRHDIDVKVGADRLSEDPKGGFKNIGHFCCDVAKAQVDEGVRSGELDMWTKATLSTYGSEGVGTDGGFAVPPEYREQIMVHVQAEDGLLGRCDQYNISGNSIAFPDDETTPWGSSGIQGYWEGEAQAITQSKPSLKLKELKTRKVSALVPVTEELLEDAGAMGSYITRKAGQVLAFKVDDAIINGTGAGQPLGVLNASCTISVAKAGGQEADTVKATNVIDMYSRMYAPYRRNAVWVCNQDIESNLMKMAVIAKTDAAALTSVGGLVYIPAGNIAGAPFGTLLGRPVIFHQACQTLGTVGDIILADFSQYAVALRGGLQSMSSMHLFFDQDAVAFKFRMRIDGQPWLSSSIAAKNGSNTMSSFITVAVR